MSCSFHSRVRQVVDEPAHRRVLEVRVQVDEARHERGETEVAHRLVGMQRAQVLEVADLDDPVVAHEHGAVLDVRRGDGQHVAGGEQHGVSSGFGTDAILPQLTAELALGSAALLDRRVQRDDAAGEVPPGDRREARVAQLGGELRPASGTAGSSR